MCLCGSITVIFRGLLGNTQIALNRKGLCLPLAMKKVFLFVFIISFITIISLIGSSCANIIPPSGGPRDSLPPVLVNATPKDSTLNFKSNRITLTFDEYVDLQEVQQNLLFTPTFESNPVIEAKLRTLTLRLRDSLEPNTTYTFNFGNAIKDINEGNVLKNFTYVFSTGSYLDSLEISGNVVLAQTGKVDSTLTVILHTTLKDSAVVNQRPRYATRVDSSGNFTFKNLPKDTFAIYAIGEAGILRRYTNASQLFAFANEPVIAGSTVPTMYAYQAETTPTTPPRPVPANQRNAANRDNRLRLTTNVANNQQDLLDSFVLSSEQPFRNFDSTKISLSTDSTFVPVTAYNTRLDTSGKSIILTTAWKEGTRYNLILNQDFAEDTLGRKLLKTDTLTFTTKKVTDYGKIDIRVKNIDTAQNPVLQFVQNDRVVLAVPIKSGRYTQTLFIPGEYDLRILYDKNKNGKWDPGQFFGQKMQPEIVEPISRKITIKANWDNEFEVAL